MARRLAYRCFIRVVACSLCIQEAARRNENFIYVFIGALWTIAAIAFLMGYL
jgi:hypothetical protein